MVLPPLLRLRVLERSFVMSIIERKFDGNPWTSGGFSVAPIIDDVSDDMLIVKKLLLNTWRLGFWKEHGFIQPEVRLETNKLIALQGRGSRSCRGDGVSDYLRSWHSGAVMRDWPHLVALLAPAAASARQQPSPLQIETNADGLKGLSNDFKAGKSFNR